MDGLLWREDTGLREGVRSCSTPIPNPHLAEVSRPRRNRRTPGAAKTPLPPDPEPNQEAARKPMGTKSTFCNRHASWLAPISSSVSPGIAGWHQTRVLEATGALLPQKTRPDAYTTRVWCHKAPTHLRNAASGDLPLPLKQIRPRKARRCEAYWTYVSTCGTRRAAIHPQTSCGGRSGRRWVPDHAPCSR